MRPQHGDIWAPHEILLAAVLHGGSGVDDQVRSGLPAGASRIRTLGPTPSLAGRQTARTRLIFSPSKFIAPVEALAAVSAPLLECRHSRFKRRLRAGWRLVGHFKPNGPTSLSPHSGSRSVSQFAALLESATMHSFATHSSRRSPDGSLAAITVCLPITWPVPLWDRPPLLGLAYRTAPTRSVAFLWPSREPSVPGAKELVFGGESELRVIETGASHKKLFSLGGKGDHAPLQGAESGED